MNNNLDVSYIITYHSEDILSFYFYDTVNQAASEDISHGYTLNINTEKLLSLSDIGINVEELKAKLKGEINTSNREYLTDYISKLSGKERNFSITDDKLKLFIDGGNGEQEVIHT